MSKKTIEREKELREQIEALRAHVQHLRLQNERMRGEIRALTFAVKCNGVCGGEVKYEAN